MKKIKLIFAMMVSCIITFGQNETFNSAVNLSIEAGNRNPMTLDNFIVGSPYNGNEFINAIFYQKERPTVKSATRLNYFRSNFEFMIENKIYMVDPLSIDSIKVKDQTYLFKTFEYNGKTSPRIVELIGKREKSSLYKYIEVEFKPEVKAGSYIDPKPATYLWDEPVYLIEIGDKIIALTSFNKLTNSIPQKEKEMKQFIKSQKIKKDDPSGLLLLLQYVDKLI
jgi:hypothetical protein